MNYCSVDTTLLVNFRDWVIILLTMLSISQIIYDSYDVWMSTVPKIIQIKRENRNKCNFLITVPKNYRGKIFNPLTSSLSVKPSPLCRFNHYPFFKLTVCDWGRNNEKDDVYWTRSTVRSPSSPSPFYTSDGCQVSYICLTTRCLCSLLSPFFYLSHGIVVLPIVVP